MGLAPLRVIRCYEIKFHVSELTMHFDIYTCALLVVLFTAS